MRRTDGPQKWIINLFIKSFRADDDEAFPARTVRPEHVAAHPMISIFGRQIDNLIRRVFETIQFIRCLVIIFHCRSVRIQSRFKYDWMISPRKFQGAPFSSREILGSISRDPNPAVFHDNGEASNQILITVNLSEIIILGHDDKGGGGVDFGVEKDSLITLAFMVQILGC